MALQRYQDEPITIGLRIKPTPRQQRKINQNRDFNEKQRVMQRQENYERHEEAQIVNKASYNEHHRFGDDFLQIQKEERAQKIQRKQEYYQMLRDQQRDRDQMYMDRDLKAEQTQQMFDQQRNPRKNHSGERFNIVTREYFDPADAEKERLKHEADLALAEARKQSLIKKQGLGVNLLTGEPYGWNK